MANQTVYHLTYPSANLYLAKKWDIAKHEKHLNKLKEMKPAIGTLTLTQADCQDMEAPVGFGKSDKDILERARKEVKRISKEQEAKNYIHEGNLKIVKKIAAIKLDTHRQWLLRESIVKKSPFNPFLERRMKEQKRIEVDNNKLVLKVETQKSGLEYQKLALLRYYERNKNVGRKLGDFKTVQLQQKDIVVRVNEMVVVPRSTEKACVITRIVQKRGVRGIVKKAVAVASVVQVAEVSVAVIENVVSVAPVPTAAVEPVALVEIKAQSIEEVKIAPVVQEEQHVLEVVEAVVEAPVIVEAPVVVEAVVEEPIIVEAPVEIEEVVVKAASIEAISEQEPEIVAETAASIHSVHVETVEAEPAFEAETAEIEPAFEAETADEPQDAPAEDIQLDTTQDSPQEE